MNTTQKRIGTLENVVKQIVEKENHQELTEEESHYLLWICINLKRIMAGVESGRYKEISDLTDKDQKICSLSSFDENGKIHIDDYLMCIYRQHPISSYPEGSPEQVEHQKKYHIERTD